MFPTSATPCFAFVPLCKGTRERWPLYLFSLAVDRKAKPQEWKQAKIVLQSHLNSCCCAISLEIINRLEVSDAIRCCVAPEAQGCAFESLFAHFAKVIKSLLALVHHWCNFFYCVPECACTPFQTKYTHMYVGVFTVAASFLFFFLLCGLAFCSYTNRISGHQCWNFWETQNTTSLLSLSKLSKKEFLPSVEVVSVGETLLPKSIKMTSSNEHEAFQTFEIHLMTCPMILPLARWWDASD